MKAPTQRIMQEVTFGVTTSGNIRALTMALASVLQGNVIPAKIILRFEGSVPGMNDFYLEQLACLARFKFVDFQLSIAASVGIRAARDWLIDTTTTTFLWMGDDDVIYAPHCLEELMQGYTNAVKMSARHAVGFINGNKPDLNNRRGYGDFTLVSLDSRNVKDRDSYNQPFHGPGRTVFHNTMDTGNVLIHVHNTKAKKIRFSHFGRSYNAGGEDTLFALLCHRAGLLGFFHTRADSFHLEKPEVRFGEFAARKNMLLRECELLGIDPVNIENMMPGVK